MDESRKSLTIAVVFGIIISIVAGAIIINDMLSMEETPFAMFFIFMIVIAFFGSTFWIYHQIEYDRKKYKGEKRTWWAWYWYPQRKWSEAIYWRGISRVTFGVPFLIYFWVVFIIGYSAGVGLFLAILSFLLVILTIHEIFHLSETSDTSVNNIPIESKKSTWFVVPILFIILLAVVLSLPYIEQPKGNYGVSSTEQEYIGVWSNSDISFTFEANHTCVAIYNDTTYNGWWHYDFFSVKITWSNVLQLPHPNNPSQLYPIEDVYLINDGNSISLYTMFQAPSYLTLNKVS